MSSVESFWRNKADRVQRWWRSGLATKDPELARIRVEELLFWQTAYSVLESAAFHPSSVAMTVAENHRSKLELGHGSKTSFHRVQVSFRANLGMLDSLRALAPGRGLCSMAGLRALSTGFPIACCSLVLSDLWLFYPYVWLRDWLSARALPPWFASSAAGAATTPPALVAFLPLQVIYRQQVEQRIYGSGAGALAAAREIHRAHGMRGFVRGMLGVLVIRVPAAALNWSIYEAARQKLEKATATTHVGLSFLAGGSAAALSTFLLRPANVVIARKQTERPDVSYRLIAKSLLEHEGPGAFYKGVQAAVLNSSLRMGVFYTCFSSFITLATD